VSYPFGSPQKDDDHDSPWSRGSPLDSEFSMGKRKAGNDDVTQQDQSKTQGSTELYYRATQKTNRMIEREVYSRSRSIILKSGVQKLFLALVEAQASRDASGVIARSAT